MKVGGYHRRSFLAALGVSGLLGTAGLAPITGATANSVESSDSTTDVQVLYEHVSRYGGGHSD